jgi:SAM-dependent methyltransferase
VRSDLNYSPNTEPHRAFWDFSARIITPTIARLLPEPRKAHAVEIGYRDDALLIPASHYFGSVTGISMGQQDDEAAARQLTQLCGQSRVSFAEWEPSRNLPLPDSSADFVYSLYGTTRLPDLATFEALITDCARVLRPGGVAMLCFGRLSRLPFAPPGKSWLRGYAVRPSPDTGEPTFHLRMFHARRAVLSAGMKAVSLSTPMHPDTSWRLFRGGNLSYITAWKPRQL